MKSEAKKEFLAFTLPTVPTSNKGITISQFHETKFEPYAKKKYTLKTQKHFNVAVRMFTSLQGDLPIAKVGIEDIQHFLAAVEHDTSSRNF